MNQENLHTQLWGTLYMNSGTTQHQHRVASLPQVPNRSSSYFTLLAQQRTGWGAVRMLSQCLKTLPASAEPCPHSKLKPVEFLKITLLYNRWSLSLITGLLLPYNAMVITDKSGCPVTPTQFKAHLNPTPFSPSKVNLCSCLVYAPSCPEWKKTCFSIQPAHSVISSKVSHLSQGKTIFQKALIWATYPSSDPWCCWTAIIHPLKKQKHSAVNEAKY